MREFLLKLFNQSLLCPAITSGNNANCFFQSFMHVFTRLPNKIHSQLLHDDQYQLPLQHLVDNFNQIFARRLPKPFNFIELIELSRILHPLDRELVFSSILRATYNTLVKADIIQTEPLGLGEHDIVLVHQTVAFANCFGARLSAYMSEEELQKAQTRGMPLEVANRISMHKIAIDGVIFVCDRQPDQPRVWDLNLVFAGIHLNYTFGTPELNQQERNQVRISQSNQGAYVAAGPADSKSAPLVSASSKEMLAFRIHKLFCKISLSSNLTKLLSTNTSIFRRLEDKFLERHRHDNSKIQHEYDKRFGLVVRQ